MRILVLFIAVVSLFTSTCLANGYVTASAVPTPGMDGFSTYTVSVYSRFSATNGVSVNFQGPLNQHNPFGMFSVFKDVFGQIVSSEPLEKQDSHFTFYSNEILSLNTSESTQHLRGDLTTLASFNVGSTLNFAHTLDFAQLVIPDDESVSYSVFIDNGTGIAFERRGEINTQTVGTDPILLGGGTLSFDRPGGYYDSRSAELRVGNMGPVVDTVTITGVSITGADATAFTAPMIGPSNNIVPTAIPERFSGRSIPVTFQPYDSVLRNYNADLTLHTTAGDVLYQLVANQIPPVLPKEIVDWEIKPTTSTGDDMATWDVRPTPGLPEFTTFTLTVKSEQGPITGLRLNASGPMNQVQVFNTSTPFTDLFEATGVSGEQDSHLLFRLADVDALGLWKDDADQLYSGGISGLAALNVDGELRVAQIVVRNGESVSFDGLFALNGVTEHPLRGTLNPPVVPIPEPATALLLTLGAAIAALSWSQKRVRQGA